MTISEVATLTWQWVETMGWHQKTPLESLALIASEVGEAVNECRHETPSPKLGEELADIILRTLDLAHELDIPIEAMIEQKMRLNRCRGTRGRAK